MKHNVPYIILSCESTTFTLSKQSNFDLSLLNSSFHNFEFSSYTKNFPNDEIKQFLTEYNFIETPLTTLIIP